VDLIEAMTTTGTCRYFRDDPVPDVVCAELDGLHPTDNELGRLSVVGGGSIYPTVQNFCLALRAQGVASAITTLLCQVTATARSKAQIARFFGDLELLDPGLVRIPLWRPEWPPTSHPDRIWMYGGVGVKR